MMENVIYVFLTFFAVYGLIQMLIEAFATLRLHGCPGAWPHHVIALQNCEDTVEGLLRTLLWQTHGEDWIVLDLGSSDETGEILARLEKEYASLRILSPAEYRTYLDTIDHDVKDRRNE